MRHRAADERERWQERRAARSRDGAEALRAWRSMSAQNSSKSTVPLSSSSTSAIILRMSASVGRPPSCRIATPISLTSGPAAVGVIGGEGVLVLLELRGGEEDGVAIASAMVSLKSRRLHATRDWTHTGETVQCGECE